MLCSLSVFESRDTSKHYCAANYVGNCRHGKQPLWLSFLVMPSSARVGSTGTALVPVGSFGLPKPGGGERGLGIPNVIDRWVQQAVLQMLEPIFEPTFHDSSHGFRRGRGAQTAIAQARKHPASGHTTIVDINLAKFFDRVNHQRLLARLAQRVTDKRVLELIGRMLKARVVLPEGTRVNTAEGTPQGGPLSPLLSNIVLDELDWELHRRGLRFVRYADDANIFVGSRSAGQRVMAAGQRFLEKRLRLFINPEKSAVRRPQEVHFLGFRFCRNKEEAWTVHLSHKTVERVETRLKELTPRNWGQSLLACIKERNRYIKGWVPAARACSANSSAPPRLPASVKAKALKPRR